MAKIPSSRLAIGRFDSLATSLASLRQIWELSFPRKIPSQSSNLQAISGACTDLLWALNRFLVWAIANYRSRALQAQTPKIRSLLRSIPWIQPHWPCLAWGGIMPPDESCHTATGSTAAVRTTWLAMRRSYRSLSGPIVHQSPRLRSFLGGCAEIGDPSQLRGQTLELTRIQCCSPSPDRRNSRYPDEVQLELELRPPHKL